MLVFREICISEQLLLHKHSFEMQTYSKITSANYSTFPKISLLLHINKKRNENFAMQMMKIARNFIAPRTILYSTCRGILRRRMRNAQCHVMFCLRRRRMRTWLSSWPPSASACSALLSPSW
jgi:hypothetical protein